MRRAVIATCIIAVLLVTVVHATEYYTKHKGDQRRAEPDEGMALVYVFRPAMVGAAIKTWTFADDQVIGVSKPKGYYFAQVEPGKRIIWAKAENTSALEIELEAGETYYFKTTIQMGIGKARVSLDQIGEASAEKYFAKCSYCELTDAGRARGDEIAANRIDRAIKKVEKRKEKTTD
jgi:hypothetical protein